LAAGQQHEINLRDLLTEMQRNQHERHHYIWLIAAIALTLTILIIYLTSKCWRRPLLEFASRYALRRKRVPARVPVP
jgi:peptidoglycan/LPS O-acetylase OafA/YrhL